MPRARLEFILQAAFRGCCQWVLDAACEAVEWLYQPLRFDSPALCSHSTIMKSAWLRRRQSYPEDVSQAAFQLFTTIKPRPITGAFVFLNKEICSNSLPPWPTLSIACPTLRGFRRVSTMPLPVRLGSPYPPSQRTRGWGTQRLSHAREVKSRGHLPRLSALAKTATVEHPELGRFQRERWVTRRPRSWQDDGNHFTILPEQRGASRSWAVSEVRA